MTAPIVVHRPLTRGGRQVTVLEQPIGLAHNDRDLIEFLRQAGLPDGETVLDDPTQVEWRGAGPHQYEAEA